MRKNNLSPFRRWRRNIRKPMLILALLLLLTAALTVAVQAQTDEVDERLANGEPIVVEQTSGPTGTDVVVQIPVSKDAFISSANPNTNYGSSVSLRIGYDQSNYQAVRSLWQFSLSSIPPNVIINNATVSVYQYSIIPSGDAPMAVQGQYVTLPWNEFTVTWNNANYLGGDVTEVGDISSTVGWKTANVTNIVRSWYNGTRPNYGLIFTADERPDQNRMRSFYSRQQSNFIPYLTVDYTLACDNVPPIASVNSLPTFRPSSFTVSWTGTDYAPPGCAPSGIAYYDVQYRADGGSWVNWINQTTATSAAFNGGQNGAYYEFRTRAVDNAGNVQDWTGTQASTTVDTQPPSATVNPLPPFTTSESFILTWGGTDNLSGIQNYDVQYKIDDGPWLLGLQQTTLTSFQVTGAQDGVTYYFRTRATDNVGNVQSWSPGAQAQTTVILGPRADILPFQPSILKPTAPVTDSFTVRWQGVTAPGTNIIRYDIWYQYNDGAWQLWNNFTGAETSASFPYISLGFGDGRFGFEAVATNNLNQEETREGVPEAMIIVDLADLIQPVARLPLLADNVEID